MNFKYLPLIHLGNLFLLMILIFAYYSYYGIGQDIEALESITKHKVTIHWNLIEFLINNIGFFTKIFGISPEVGIIFLQIFGALLNIIAIKKVLPNSYAIFYFLLPNFYLSSFSTVQMNILIPLWFLFTLSQSHNYKFFYALIGVCIHWLMIPLIFFYILSLVSTRRLILLTIILALFLNIYVIEFLLSSLEIIVGGSRYTSFLTPHVQKITKFTSIIPFIAIIFGIVERLFNFKKNFDYSQHTLIKCNAFVILVAGTLYMSGVPIEYSLRIINLNILPILYIILKYRNIGKSQFTPLVVYLILSLNFIVKF